jgi:alpha-mannosidase
MPDTIDALLEDPEQGQRGEAIDRRLQAALDRAAASLAGALADPGAARRTGRLLLNPLGATRRVCVELPAGGELPPVGGAIRAAEADGRSAAAVVDVPPMGFAWIGPDMTPPEEPEPRKARRSWLRRAAKPQPPMAEVEEGVYLLRNEFFEITFDSATGAIRAVSDYVSRRPRLAQQLALRVPRPGSQDPGSDENYSIMAADEIAVTSAGPIVGEVFVRGRLVDREGQRVAGFRQTTRTYRGSRLLELDIELDVERQPAADPWHSYYGCRFAWSDETANVYRSVSLANVPTDAAQIEAPHFVHLAAGKLRTTFLTGGLPYHRRFGLNRLDTLLVVRGETARRFRLAVGMDLPHPVPAALEFLAPQTTVTGAARPPIPSGWLFHLDSRHAAATHWEPLARESEKGDCPPEKKGTVPFFGGLRVRLLETDGRKLNLGLRCFRRPASAKKLQPGDTPDADLLIEGDRVTVPLGAHEWAEVEIRFAGS